MDSTIKLRLRHVILEAVPDNGDSIGNIALLRGVGQAMEAAGQAVDEADVNTVREQLIEEGVLAKGRGRGGSVRRVRSSADTSAPTTKTEASATGTALEHLRERLLDLTARNRLLNFHHTRKQSLRVIDELPNQIVSTLLDGKKMRFGAVPEPSEEQLVRAGFLRLDEQIGGPVQLGKCPDAREWAEHLGLATSYEVPVATDSRGGTKHSDKVIQSLYYPHELEVRLKTLRQAAESAIQEMGANILYLAVGFLEWYESKDSDVKRLAPLILVPVRLHQGALNPEIGTYEYAVTYSDEGLVSNISLREKLRVDFGIALPDLDDSTMPEDYLRNVAGLIKVLQPRWKVRRYISLALFNFSKLLMYLDLDPGNWPDEFRITDHAIVTEILSGPQPDKDSPESSPGTMDFGEEYSIDNIEDVHARYPLIEDADSSQHSALIDAVDGKNLVIEGPPGTGKSQTITNIIAAAMAQRKTVLFVAEKLAALEVVHSRLEAAGLDGFCLELHSHKAQKRKLLDNVQARIRQHLHSQSPTDLTIEITRYQERRAELVEYTTKVNQHWKKTGKTLYEIFTSAVRYRNAISVSLDTFHGDGCNGDHYDVAMQRRQADCVQAYRKVYQAIAESLGSELGLQQHPWFGIQNDDLQIFDGARTCAALEAWQSALRDLLGQREAVASTLGCDAMAVAQDVDQVRTLTESLHAFPNMEGDEIIEALPRLRDMALDDALRQRDLFVGIQNGFRELRGDVAVQVLRNLSVVEQLAPASDTLGHFVKADITLGRLARAVKALKAVEQELDALTMPLRAVSSTFGACAEQYLTLSIDGLSEYKTAIELVAMLPHRYWEHRNSAFDNEELDEVLPRLRRQVEQLHTLERKLDGTYALDRGLEERELRELDNALAVGGPLRWFKNDWRVARKQLLAHASSPRVKLSDMRAKLDDAAAFARQRAELDADVVGHETLGSLFHGYETDLDTLETLRAWYEQVRRVYGVGFGQRAAVGDALIKLPRGAVAAIQSLARRQVPQQLDRLCETLNGLQAVFSPAAQLKVGDAPLIDDAGVIPSLLQRVNEAMQACSPLADDDTRTVASLTTLAARLTELHEKVQAWTAGNLDQTLFSGQLGLQADVDADNEHGLLALTHTLRLAQFCDRELAQPVLSEFVYRTPTRDTLVTLASQAEALRVVVDEERAARKQYVDLVRLDVEAWLSTADGTFDQLLARNQRALDNPDSLQAWLEYVRVRHQLEACGLRRVVVAVETAQLPVEEMEDACRAVVFDALAREALKEDAKLARFSGKTHSVLREQFVDCDDRLKTLQRQQVAWAIDQVDPPVGTRGARVSDLTELQLLEHECSKKKRHIPIRALIERAGKALLALKPCFMMGPMSVAQYLKPGSVYFDLVVMDEASQVRPQDAIGAVARGGQLVVVGDPKQLPPTSFFDRLADAGDEDNRSSTEEAESILDAVWPLFHRRLLRWHYRSRHQDLIAFSNYSFYDGNLILFPSPYKESSSYGIRYHRVPHGTFVNNRNLEEARVIADAVKRHFQLNADETLGVACMNAEQRLHIERTIEALAKDDPILQTALDEDANRRESLFIKNLENVQGDERDVMLISMTYGPREPGGRVMQRFGPINSPTGERRLNVLFTRARKQMHIFSSMDSGDIAVAPGKQGVAALRDFLSYCETGMLATAGTDTGRPPDSDFEVTVIAALKKEGFDCRPQVGVAGYFIDVAVIDPGKPGRYLVGIECDGATYHSAKSTRDRDRLRQEVLEHLGWRIWRIWSTDWYKNPAAVLAPVVKKLHELRSEVVPALQEADRPSTIGDIVDDTVAETTQTGSIAYQTGSLRDKLIQFDREVIRKEVPDTPDPERLLRPAMVEALLEFQPTDRTEFLELIPPFLRKRTDSQEGKYLDQVFQIINSSVTAAIS